jgi:hypothetical protein
MDIVYPETCYIFVIATSPQIFLEFAVFFENLPKLPTKCFTLLRPQKFNYLDRPTQLLFPGERNMNSYIKHEISEK